MLSFSTSKNDVILIW